MARTLECAVASGIFVVGGGGGGGAQNTVASVCGGGADLPIAEHSACTRSHKFYFPAVKVVVINGFKILKDASRSFIILESFAGNLPTLKRALHFTQIHWYRYNVSVFMTILMMVIKTETL